MTNLMSEHRRATAVYRSAVGLLRHGDDGEGAATSGWTFEEVMERLGDISPSGWPQCDPRRYDEQLQLKRAACELAFPECSKCDLHVFPSPPLHHRMRCRFGITHNGGSPEYAAWMHGSGPTTRVDSFLVASEAICEAMPILLSAISASATLSKGLAAVHFLSSQRRLSDRSDQGPNVVAALLYECPIDEVLWRAAAESARETWAPLRIDLVGQSRRMRVVVGGDWIIERFHLEDGRTLSYRHVLGHFSNPNAAVCMHTINWLSSVASSVARDGEGGLRDLLELYCGNGKCLWECDVDQPCQPHPGSHRLIGLSRATGNHTVALARLFRRVLAVEIDPTLCAAANENLATNSVENVKIVTSPSHEFCQRILRRKHWVDFSSGHEFEFGTVLVDPPRAGLDAETRRLVAQYDHILYISCNPFDSLRRDLDHFKEAGLELHQLALLDHFPYTRHTECAAYIRRPPR